MRLTDADAIIKKQHEIMEAMYCSTIPELKKHMNIDDDLSIYIHCMEQFSRAKQFYHGLRGILENAPTVDAVIVTRCKDCKFWDSDPDTYGKDTGPEGKCMKSFERMPADGFCSYGESEEKVNDGRMDFGE